MFNCLFKSPFCVKHDYRAAGAVLCLDQVPLVLLAHPLQKLSNFSTKCYKRLTVPQWS